MGNLDYYYRTNSYELENILKKGLSYDYYNTASEYGFCLYMSGRPNVNFDEKNIVTRVHFKNLDGILFVKNFQELLTDHMSKITATSAVNINTQSAPVNINNVSVIPGNIIGLAAQNNASENGRYLYLGAGKPIERYLDVSSYINTFGITDRIGTKAVVPYMRANKYSGVMETGKKLMVLYDTTNIRYIKLYDKNNKHEHVQ